MKIELRKSEKFRAKVLGLDEHNHHVVILAMWVEWWIRRAARNNPRIGYADGIQTDTNPRWMILAGNTGTGKTHCLKRAHTFFLSHAIDLWPDYWKNPPSVYFSRWVKASQLRHDEWKDVIRDISESNIIFLDDIGAEVDQFKQGEKCGRLQELLDTIERKWCLITTNIMPEQWRERLDTRNASRLNAAKIVTTESVEDYRPKMAEVATH